MVPLCGYFGPQVEVNNMYKSAAQNVTWNPKCGPKQKESQRNLYFFPTWESARIYFWWIRRPQMNQSSAKNHGFGKMVGMDLPRRIGLLWRLPGMVSGKHEEHQSFFMFFYHSRRVREITLQRFDVVSSGSDGPWLVNCGSYCQIQGYFLAIACCKPLMTIT